MMHILRATLIALSLASSALLPLSAQPTFYARYGPSFSDAGYITPSLDNAFYGITRHASGEYLTYYKLDQQGDLVWIKQAAFSPPMFPTRVSALSDSTFAFLALQPGSSASVFVYKFTDDGDMLWGTSLDIGSSANFQALAPTTDGGMILTGAGCLGADMIIHLDADGHILSQHGHSSLSSSWYFPNAMDMVHDGNNQYSYMGYAAQAGNTYAPLTFWRSDSAGTVTSYREIHFAGGPAHAWPLGKSIVRSPSGGHYIAVGQENGVGMVSNVAMLYLNAQDELQWIKTIETNDELLALSGICATEDGGCVIVGNNVFSVSPSFYYNTYALKFNEQGDMLWSTMVGDMGTGGWDRVGIQSIVPSADGSMMTVPIRYGGFDFCKVDEEFNGFCYTTPFAPILTDVEPLVLPYTLTPTVINFVEGPGAMDAEPASYARTNICFSTEIPEAQADPALAIAPNPASDHFQLFVPTDRPQRAEVSLINALGAVCSTRKVEALPGQSLLGETSDLPAGTYVVEVRIGSMRQRAMLVVQH